MCAAIPMFRVRSSGNFRSAEFGFFVPAGFFSIVAVAIKLPAEVSERAVSLSHLMSVFAFLDGVALAVRRVANLIGKRLRHRGATTIVGILNDPPHRQRDLPCWWHFHRDLVGSA